MTDPRSALQKELHQLPPDWEWRWQDDVFSFSGGTQPPASTFIESPREGYVRLVQIRDFDVDTHITYIPDAEKLRKCAEDDVLIARYGASLGRICRGLAGAYNVALVKTQPLDDIENDYLFYLLQSRYFQEPVQSMGTRSVQAGFNREGLSTIPLPIPPLPVQRHIAHILGTLDDKIELNRWMNRTLEAIARAIFKSWFVDFDPVHAKAEGLEPVGMDHETAALFPDSFQDSPLGKIPNGWEASTLGEICEKPQYGYTQSAAEEQVGPHFLRIKDINKQPWIEWASVPYCEITEADYEKYRLHAGDIVVARIADPGHAALIQANVDAVFASYLIRFRLLDQSYSRYVQYWLKSPGYWALVRARRSGSTRGNLNAKVLGGFPILVPPAALAEKFQAAIQPLARGIEVLLSQSGQLSTTRDALLPKLLSGELSEGHTDEAVVASA